MVCAMMGVMEMCRSNIRLIVAGLGMVLGAAAWADTPGPATPATAASTPSPVAAGTASADASTPAPSNQIWECTTNGVRTFSSNPCGTKSTVRQLNPINVMEPAPIYRPAPGYAPTMRSPAAPDRYSNPEQDSADEPTTDNAYSGYPGVIVVPRARHVRPNNVRPHPQPHPHPHHP
jgi:hypothetical protein